MNSPPIIGAVLAAALLSPAAALAAPGPVAGSWTVDGKVVAFTFTLTCKFDQTGEALSGTCYDGGTNKPHPLTAGSVTGDKVAWTYQSNFLTKTFDVHFSGDLDGARMEGTIVAPGYKGVFTATRP